MKSSIFQALPGPKSCNVVSLLSLALSLWVNNVAMQWAYRGRMQQQNGITGEIIAFETTRNVAEMGWSGAFVHSGYGWPTVGGLCHPGSRLRNKKKFTLRAFDLDAFCKNEKDKLNMTSGIRLISHPCVLRAAGMGGGEECSAEEYPAERPMKSRPLVAPGRHKGVYLAVRLRVMCLHLNEKARKAEKKRERNTGSAKRPGSLPSQDTWGMQQQQLSLRSNTITVSAIWVRETAPLVQSASLTAVETDDR